MIPHEDLRQIVILNYLTNDMLLKLQPIIEILTFKGGEPVFRERSLADRFYMLKRGKVLLEQTLSDTVTVSLGSVKPGYAFGWSAMLDSETYTSNAICSEASKVFAIRARNLKHLLDNDPAMGYLFYQSLLRIIKKRHDHRTEQFIRVISNHPDIKGLVDPSEALT